MNTSLIYKLVYLLIGIIFLIVNSSNGQSESLRSKEDSFFNHQKESILDHLVETGIPKLQIETNLETLFNDRRIKKYYKASATFQFQDGSVWIDSLKVKVRGHFRAIHCKNPPLKIKYSKKLLKERGFKKRNEYKLVYPCESNKDHQNYIYKEYLVYKLYNALTEKSLRVHLIDFILQDSAKQVSPIQTKGFILEHREELIKRLDAVKDDTRCLPIKKLSTYDYTLFQVFQFMIGNVDWIIPTCKNIEIIQLKDNTLIPVPYDFDYSGIVNPSYAKPITAFNQVTVTDRYFLGHKKELKELMPVFELFKQKEAIFIDIISSFEYLPKMERKILLRYLKSFYKILDNPKKIKKVFVHDMGKTMEELY